MQNELFENILSRLQDRPIRVSDESGDELPVVLHHQNLQQLDLERYLPGKRQRVRTFGAASLQGLVDYLRAVRDPELPVHAYCNDLAVRCYLDAVHPQFAMGRHRDVAKFVAEKTDEYVIATKSNRYNQRSMIEHIERMAEYLVDADGLSNADQMLETFRSVTLESTKTVSSQVDEHEQGLSIMEQAAAKAAEGVRPPSKLYYRVRPLLHLEPITVVCHLRSDVDDDEIVFRRYPVLSVEEHAEQTRISHLAAVRQALGEIDIAVHEGAIEV